MCSTSTAASSQRRLLSYGFTIKPMNRPHRRIRILLVHDQADAALARSLRDGDDVEALRAQRAEDAPSDARRVPHARADHRDDDDILQRRRPSSMSRSCSSRRNSSCTVAITLRAETGGHGEADALLGRSLRDQRHAGVRARHRAKRAGGYARYAQHTAPFHRQSSSGRESPSPL